MTIYIMNRCPTKSLKNKVPQEAWIGMNPSVSHLKIFGCVAYAHVPDELRKNLEKKGHKCIFVGYSEDTKAYKMCDPKSHCKCINKGILWRNKNNSGVIPPDIGELCSSHSLSDTGS